MKKKRKPYINGIVRMPIAEPETHHLVNLREYVTSRLLLAMAGFTYV